MQLLRTLVHSRIVLVLGVLVSILVPALTLPSLPSVSPWPVALGLLPWIVGKYVLCPLRWRALTDAHLGRRWHLRAYAESELLGLLTPGHVGAHVWRMHRLTRAGLGRGDALMSVGADRFVGAVGLALFVAFAGAALPVHLLVVALAIGALAIVAFFVVRRVRPDQLSIAALLLGTIQATGHTLSPLAVLGAFGASQIAGAVPGPNGASPRDGALVVALVALGVPWAAAAAAVAVKAAVAWLPALVLGGASLVLTRRALRRANTPSPALAVAAA